MNGLIKTVGGITVILCWVWCVNWSLWLLNQPSNLSLAAGAAAFAVATWLMVLVEKRLLKGIITMLKGISLLLLMLSVSGCYTVVSPGHVGIDVELSGGEKGVKDLPLKTGRVFYNPINEQVLVYPTYMQNATWTKDPREGVPSDDSITFTAKGGIVVNADISASYQLLTDQVPQFYVKFRSDDLNLFTHGFFKTAIRNNLNEIGGKYEIENIMGDNAQFLTESKAAVAKELLPYGVHLEQFGFIGAPRPPKNIIDSINAKTAATQKAIQSENEVRQVQAQAAKDVARAEGEAKAKIAQAEGEAKANALKSSSITTTILDWERLETTKLAIAKWNGVPSMINGSGGSPTNFLFQIPQGK